MKRRKESQIEKELQSTMDFMTSEFSETMELKAAVKKQNLELRQEDCLVTVGDITNLILDRNDEIQQVSITETPESVDGNTFYRIVAVFENHAEEIKVLVNPKSPFPRRQALDDWRLSRDHDVFEERILERRVIEMAIPERIKIPEIVPEQTADIYYLPEVNTLVAAEFATVNEV